MKVALIHDSLQEFGGAERVLAELVNIFPKAQIFTSCYQKEVIKKYLPSLKKNQIHHSWYQFFPYKTTTTIQFLAPLIWRFKSINNFDLVITSSSYYLSSLTALGQKNDIHYIHSLPKNLFGLEKESYWQKKLNLNYQKKLYLQSLKNSFGLITNSKNIQTIVKDKTGFNSTVIYPPVKIPTKKPKLGKRQYFLIISRIDETKKIEMAIKACNYLNLPLKIAGTINNHDYLKKLKNMAGKKTKILGPVSEKERKKLYQNALAFLFCSKNEDFGIAPVEAMGYGLPVIAYFGGGVKETVKEGQDGLFFYQHNWQSLAKTIKKFDYRNFDSNKIYKNAQKFNQENFKKNLINYFRKKKISF